MYAASLGVSLLPHEHLEQQHSSSPIYTRAGSLSVDDVPKSPGDEGVESPRSSSETQGQIKGARESLNGRKIYMERRKVKNGEKSPWGQCLTRPVPNGRCRSGF